MVNRGKRGFSLLEMVAVMLVMAVMGVAAARFLLDPGGSVMAESAILAARLRFAQSLALANNTATWGIDLSSGSYTLRRNGAIAPIDLPGSDSPTHTFPSEVRVTAGSGSVSFDEWGSAGGADRDITLSDGTQTRSLRIIANTGYIQ